jgi:hypothetical protein
MPRTPDYFTQMLPGQMIFILGGAALLAFPISFLLLRLYRRAVLKSMSRQAEGAEAMPGAGEPPSPPPSQPAAPLQIISLQGQEYLPFAPEAQSRHDLAVRAPWRAAIVYSLGGVCYAIFLAAAYLIASRMSLVPGRLVMLSWLFAWPLLLTLILVAGSTSRIKLQLMLAYFCGYVIIGAINVARNPQFSFLQLFGIWLIYNAVPTALVLAYLARRVRAVGPLVLTFLVAALSGSVIFVMLFTNEYLLRLLVRIPLSATTLFIGLHLVGFIGFGALGWPLIRWLKAGYEQKKLSDQSLTVDSLWLLFSLVYAFSSFIFQGPLWILAGVIAFLIYKLVVGLGFTRFKKPLPGPGIKLLLLRVFSLGKRSEKLFDAFGTNWRYIGSIQMIAGPDLATAIVEPHEFLEFLTGKLSRRFIGNRQTLELRLSEMDLRPDRDWRYRVNDFFCFTDTWKLVLHRLVSESDAVLMDLRSFSRERAGCIFEITELINSVSLDRAIFIVDATTDEPFLRQTIQQAWEHLRPDSPNYSSPAPRLQLFHYSETQPSHQLLRAVCAAAAPSSPAAP